MVSNKWVKISLAVCLIIILTLGYGGLCQKDKDKDTVSGSSAPPTPWTKQLGTGLGDDATGVATDTNGNIYVAGNTLGGLDGNTKVGSVDLFVVKYNPSGEKQWTEQLGTTAEDVTHGVATDTSGNIYVAGYTEGTFTGFTNLGGYDLLVVKYNTDGDWQWTEQLGTAANDYAMGVATDTSGNIYLTGYTVGTFTDFTNLGGYDLFVVKYNTDGDWQWTEQLGTAATDVAQGGVATDTSDNIYVAGYTTGVISATVPTGGQDIFMVKYDGAGVKQWARQLGTTANDSARGIAIDSSSPVTNIYVVGGTCGGLDDNLNAGEWDIFIVKYDSAGVKQWARQLGTALDDVAYGVATDTSGNIYVAGYTEGNLGDVNVNPNPGLDDLFVVKYNSDGVKQWTRQLGTTLDDVALGVATDTSGNIYVTGYTNGGLDGNTNAGASDFFVVKYNSAGEKQ